MGRCIGCKKPTQNFCHVHQEFVCPDCLVNLPGHARCVVGSYRGWVQDSSYNWPPKCAICAKEVLSEDGISRLICLAIAHNSCLENKVDTDGNCPHCTMSLLPAFGDNSAIAKRLNDVMKNFTWVAKIRTENGPVSGALEPGEKKAPSTNAVSVEVGPTIDQTPPAPALPLPANSSLDLESGPTDGRPVVTTPASTTSGRVDDGDDKQLKARKGMGRRRLLAAQKYFRMHRRQLLLLSLLFVCVALSVILISSAIGHTAIDPSPDY